MDHWSSSWALLCEDVDVGHYIVARESLLGCRRLKINVADLQLHLGDLGVADLQS